MKYNREFGTIINFIGTHCNHYPENHKQSPRPANRFSRKSKFSQRFLRVFIFNMYIFSFIVEYAVVRAVQKSGVFLTEN